MLIDMFYEIVWHVHLKWFTDPAVHKQELFKILKITMKNTFLALFYVFIIIFKYNSMLKL